MYDFESVSVSSFEAASLAATLTEKSADGWDVVAIVPAGSDVVAYLRRSSATDSAAEGAEQITDGTSNTIQFAESTTDSAAAELLTPTSVSSEPAVTTADITSPTSTPATPTPGAPGGAPGRKRRPQKPPAVGRAARSRPSPPRGVGRRNRPTTPGDAVGAGRLVRRPGGSLRAALLGRCGVDRARLPGRTAVHRSARRLR